MIRTPDSYRTCAGLFMLLAAAIPWLPACTTTIIPPADPSDPVVVFLLDQGHTPSLVLTAGEEKMLRYAYGDWRYYALQQNDKLSGLRALLLPTQAALGRGEIAGPVTPETIRAAVPVFIEQLYPIEVERSRAEALRSRLDAIYEQHEEPKVINDAYGMTFVHHPDDYIFFHNSNHAVASWLEELGCEARGWALLSRWQVEEPH
jgi:hypothetical protein